MRDKVHTNTINTQIYSEKATLFVGWKYPIIVIHKIKKRKPDKYPAFSYIHLNAITTHFFLHHHAAGRLTKE